jgi:hypothetical protein
MDDAISKALAGLRIYVLAGEGTGSADFMQYKGAVTSRALKARITRERAGGDRWVRTWTWDGQTRDSDGTPVFSEFRIEGGQVEWLDRRSVPESAMSPRVQYLHVETGSVDDREGWIASYDAEELAERGLSAVEAFEADEGRSLIAVDPEDRFRLHQLKAAHAKSPRKAESSRSNGLRGGRKPLEWRTWKPGAEPRGLGDAVGLAIAEGHGHYRPRLRADDFDGLVEIEGITYRASCRWPDGAETHQVTISYAPMEPRP